MSIEGAIATGASAAGQGSHGFPFPSPGAIAEDLCAGGFLPSVTGG